MCVFKDKHYGKYLDKNISQFLLEYTSTDDIYDAVIDADIKFSTLRQVRSRNIPMSKASSVGIVNLMKIAVDNCGNVELKAKNRKNKFSKILGYELAK